MRDSIFRRECAAVHSIMRQNRRLSGSVERKRAEFVTDGGRNIPRTRLNTVRLSLSTRQHNAIRYVMLYVMYARGMGVDHGGTRGQVLQNLEWGTLMQIVRPPQILSCWYKKSVPWPSKYAKIRFRPGQLARTLSRTPLRELMTLPQTT